MKLLVPAVALLLLVSAPVAAQYTVDDYKITFGGAIGAAIPASPSGLTDVTNTNTSMSGFLSGRVHGPWSWRADFGFDQFTCKDEVCAGGADPNFSYTRIAGGVQYTTNGRLHGYGFFTVGAYQQELGASLPQLPFSLKEWRFALAFGGGANYMVGTNWGVGGDLHIHAVTQGDGPVASPSSEGDGRSTVWYLTPAGQVFWRF